MKEIVFKTAFGVAVAIQVTAAVVIMGSLTVIALNAFGIMPSPNQVTLAQPRG